MTTTYINAISEMETLFLTNWNANSAAIAGYIPEIKLPTTEFNLGKPPKDLHWGRISTQTVIEHQSTFRGGLDCVQRYQTQGLLFIQLFHPYKPNSLDEGRELAMLARNTFRSTQTPSNVWFRNARINELRPDASMFRFNVIVDYQYDEIL